MMMAADLVQTVRQLPGHVLTDLAVGVPIVLVAVLVLVMVAERSRRS